MDSGSLGQQSKLKVVSVAATISVWQVQSCRRSALWLDGALQPWLHGSMRPSYWLLKLLRSSGRMTPELIDYLGS
jgi:hypothetical protein